MRRKPLIFQTKNALRKSGLGAKTQFLDLKHFFGKSNNSSSVKFTTNCFLVIHLKNNYPRNIDPKNLFLISIYLGIKRK